uniref:Uncharacterized protein n=1 Tax=Haptolina brevifila TaxID=156173 RepID=A0A7S2IT27_9EUKA
MKVIKSWPSFGDHKAGFHSFIREHAHLFSVVGQHPKQIIVPASMRAPANGSQATDREQPVISAAARAASARATPQPTAQQSASQSTPQLAPSHSPLRPDSAGRGLHTMDPNSLRDDLAALKHDLAAAQFALNSAFARMHRLSASLEVEADDAYTSSTA